jgi:hypothetical protein
MRRLIWAVVLALPLYLADTAIDNRAFKAPNPELLVFLGIGIGVVGGFRSRRKVRS